MDSGTKAKRLQADTRHNEGVVEKPNADRLTSPGCIEFCFKRSTSALASTSRMFAGVRSSAEQQPSSRTSARSAF